MSVYNNPPPLTVGNISFAQKGQERMPLDFESLPFAEDGIPARMMLRDEKQEPVSLPQFDNEMWFLSLLDGREQAAVKLAYEYAKLGQPGLPNHLYLKVIHILSELLRQVDVELEDNEDA